MSDIDVTPIPVETAYPLRQAILRPERTLAFSKYSADHAHTTLHLGAFVGGQLCGIASIYQESPPVAPDPDDWRLRDMGVLASVRRRGCGRALLHACLAHVIESGGLRFWCNARAPAVPFYLAHDFELRDEPFEMPGFGTRYFMWRSL